MIQGKPFLPMFGGKALQNRYAKALGNFPSDSKQKLQEIFEARDRASHMDLARDYAKVDPHVRAVNKLIGKRVRERTQAEQRNDSGAAQLAQSKLNDLRAAIARVMKAFKTATTKNNLQNRQS